MSPAAERFAAKGLQRRMGNADQRRVRILLNRQRASNLEQRVLDKRARFQAEVAAGVKRREERAEHVKLSRAETARRRELEDIAAEDECARALRSYQLQREARLRMVAEFQEKHHHAATRLPSQRAGRVRYFARKGLARREQSAKHRSAWEFAR